MEKNALIEFFKRYLSKQCSEEEERAFLELLNSKEHELLIKDLIDQELAQDADAQFGRLPHIQQELAQVKKNIIHEITEQGVEPRAIRYRLWFRIVAILLLCVGVVFFKMKDDRPNRVADIAPGGNKAILTLADGSRIVLDTAGKGNLAHQGAVRITKTDDGQLVYTINEGSKKDETAAGLSNSIVTPKGGQYQVNLPDGTRVWLNAASSLTFPVSFAKLKERKVELKGEAYFEVQKDLTKPFIVQSDKQIVQVLGTHFNIDAYSDEPNTKTTLLEGSVKVRGLNVAIGEEALLKPGQQARIKSASGQADVVSVDPTSEIAWKNGLFFFENEPIENIMKQITRWYDVEVVYEDDVKGKTVWGSVTRYTNVSKVLSILALTGEIHFKLEGRRITVHK